MSTFSISSTKAMMGFGLVDVVSAISVEYQDQRVLAPEVWYESTRGDGEDVSNLFSLKTRPDDQFQSDVDLWHRTLTVNGNLQGDELRVHQEQQDILTRHFIAMAMLGPNVGNQVDDIPLAALASHGGRFGYESKSSEVGERFKNQLLFGSSEAKTTEESHTDNRATEGKTVVKRVVAAVVPGTGTRALIPVKRKGGIHGGLYQRSSSHNQTYHKGLWYQLKVSTKWQEAGGVGKIGTDTYKHSGFAGMSLAGASSLGMNFAMGGVGNTASYAAAHSKKNQNVSETADNHSAEVAYTIGSEGTFLVNRAVMDHKQHGHAYFKHNSAGVGGARLMVGFEGSAPSQDSQFGAHDEKSMTVVNARSITGQQKGSELGLDFGLGGIKADVTEQKLAELEVVFAELQGGAQVGMIVSKGGQNYMVTAITTSKRGPLLPLVSLTDGGKNFAVMLPDNTGRHPIADAVQFSDIQIRSEHPDLIKNTEFRYVLKSTKDEETLTVPRDEFVSLQGLRSEPELRKNLIRELLEAKNAQQRESAVSKIQDWNLSV